MTSDTETPRTITAPASGAASNGDARNNALHSAVGSRTTAVGQRLDIYLAAVARALTERGVITGTPQRTDPAKRLIGSIVLDCTALRVAALTPDEDQPLRPGSTDRGVHPRRPGPVNTTWDEQWGWSVGLHHDPTRSSRRYLHPDLLPTPAEVADFVVGLALGYPLGSARPITAPAAATTRLHLIR